MAQEEIKTEITTEVPQEEVKKPVRKKRAPKAPKAEEPEVAPAEVTEKVLPQEENNTGKLVVEEVVPEVKEEIVEEPKQKIVEEVVAPAVEEKVVAEPLPAAKPVITNKPLEKAEMPKRPYATLLKLNPKLADSASRWAAVVIYSDTQRKILTKASRAKAETVVYNYNKQYIKR